jgi:hypothetical protein
MFNAKTVRQCVAGTGATDVRVLVGEFSFRLEVGPRITVRVFRDLDEKDGSDQAYIYLLSHSIEAPGLPPARPATLPYVPTINEAIRSAVGSIERDYLEAIAKGHRASHEWFVEKETVGCS